MLQQLTAAAVSNSHKLFCFFSSSFILAVPAFFQPTWQNNTENFCASIFRLLIISNDLENKARMFSVFVEIILCLLGEYLLSGKGAVFCSALLSRHSSENWQ